jgi:hypothetical protein
MDAQVPSPAISPGWVFICGAVMAAEALKETARLLAESPLAVAPRRPSLSTMLIAGFLLKTAVGRLGGGALGLPAGR